MEYLASSKKSFISIWNNVNVSDSTGAMWYEMDSFSDPYIKEGNREKKK